MNLLGAEAAARVDRAAGFIGVPTAQPDLAAPAAQPELVGALLIVKGAIGGQVVANAEAERLRRGEQQAMEPGTCDPQRGGRRSRC